MKLNVIIPCKNEEGNIELLHKKLTETLDEIDYELIYINDGSTDRTYDKLKTVYKADKNHVKIINFSRNFGKDAAIYAGLTHSNAQYSAIIDSDLQQNPKYLMEMIHYLDEHEDVDQIAMINKTRKNEKLITRIVKNSFYSIINSLSDTKFIKSASDFRMVRAHMVEAICALEENNRFSKGIFAWVGFNTHIMEYDVEDRHSGKTKFNFKNNLKYAMNGIVNFSTKPLKLASFMGFIFITTSFLYLLVIIFTKSSFDNVTVLINLILLIGGIQLIVSGFLGDYLAKNFIETKKRPIYIAKSKLGFNDDDIL